MTLQCESNPGRGRRALLLAVFTLGLGAIATAQTREYTTDADFDEGFLLRVNHDAPNNDQLQLGTTGVPFPYLCVPSSGSDTMVRIDVQTGAILGEYRTAPSGAFGSPSRATLDQFGNAWLGNREAPPTGNVGTVVQIGVVIGGTRIGDYLYPPFEYSTAVDRDGDGRIKTSAGAGNVFDWNPGEDPEDELILLYEETSCPNIRHISVNGDGDVWVGGYKAFLPTCFELRDQFDGSLKNGFSTSGLCGGFTGLVDGNGMIWSISLFEDQLMMHDPDSGGSPFCIDVMNAPRGAAVDSGGFVWVSGSDSVWRLDATGTVLNQYVVPNADTLYGIAVLPSDDSIWVADGEGDEVFRLNNDGSLAAQIPVGLLPNGLAVDGNGKVWVVNQDSDEVMRIDPATNAVDLIVPLTIGAQPFSISDMTGTVAYRTTLRNGYWKVTTDGGFDGVDWFNVFWSDLVPAGGGLAVQVRASDDEAALEGLPWTDVTNNGGISQNGRFLQTLVTFLKPPVSDESPILYDLTVEGEGGEPPPPCIDPNYRRPGSLLLYPEFDNRDGVVSILTVTHVDCRNVEDDLAVEFRYIDEETCLEFNRTEVLTPCDTFTFITNAHNPEQERGYVYAFAKDPRTSEALARNELVGSAMLVSGLDTFEYGTNPVVFAGIGVGGKTDVDGDGLLDLDGIEYEMAPDMILVPRFLGQSVGGEDTVHSELILIALTGGVQFETTVDFLIYNDNEEVFSGEHSFYCWEKVPLLDISGIFSDTFLKEYTDDDPDEILGAPGRESGWFRIDGAWATSPAISIPNPAFYAVLVEHVGSYGVSDLPFEWCTQDNGVLLPDGIFGF